MPYIHVCHKIARVLCDNLTRIMPQDFLTFSALVCLQWTEIMLILGLSEVHGIRWQTKHNDLFFCGPSDKRCIYLYVLDYHRAKISLLVLSFCIIMCQLTDKACEFSFLQVGQVMWRNGTTSHGDIPYTTVVYSPKLPTVCKGVCNDLKVQS